MQIYYIICEFAISVDWTALIDLILLNKIKKDGEWRGYFYALTNLYEMSHNT
jgi:hypothetical protein